MPTLITNHGTVLKPLTRRRQKLVESAIAYALSLARQRSLATGERIDDLRSAAFWGLVRAACTFDFSLNIKFTTYADKWIRHSFQQHAKDTRGLGRHGPRSYTSIDIEAVGVHVKVDAPEVTESVEDMFALMTRNMDARLVRIARMRLLDGMGLKEIGEQEGVTKERIRVLMQNAVAHMQVVGRTLK